MGQRPLQRLRFFGAERGRHRLQQQGFTDSGGEGALLNAFAEQVFAGAVGADDAGLRIDHQIGIRQQIKNRFSGIQQILKLRPFLPPVFRQSVEFAQHRRPRRRRTVNRLQHGFNTFVHCPEAQCGQPQQPRNTHGCRRPQQPCQRDVQAIHQHQIHQHSTQRRDRRNKRPEKPLCHAAISAISRTACTTTISQNIA